MNYAKMIDHTLLKQEATKGQIKKLCEEAVNYGFHSVCVNSSYVYYCAGLLKGTEAKASEARLAVQDGAEELDMVIHVGMIKSGDWDYVKQDIASVVEAAEKKALVKVILETCLLTEEEIVKACQVSMEAGADFVKTSTGFSKEGAREEDVALMRRTVSDRMGVKASGGIRTREDAERMIRAGADRLGTSSGIAILEEEITD